MSRASIAVAAAMSRNHPKTILVFRGIEEVANQQTGRFRIAQRLVF
jgi:hypothetical protein